MDYLEEHDYYTRLRNQHIQALDKERKEREQQRKQKQRDLLFAWKKEGEKGFSALQSQTNHLRTLLKPHRVMKDCMKYLDSLSSSSSSSQPHIIKQKSRIIMWNLHHQQKHHKLYKKPMNSTELIVWKLSLHKEYLHVLDTDFHKIPQRYHYLPSRNEIIIFRQLFRYYARQIHIDPKTLIELKKKRYTTRMAEKKMKMIKDTQKQCDAINYCKSLQHYNPKGCSNCGVIFIGGSLEGAVPYVKSLSRDTGVATLVTLAFELETLQKEEEIQVVLLEKVTKELQEFEHEVYSNLILSIQHFWRMVLIWKRMLKKTAKQKKSLYYYRIRRLVRMKREIDCLIKEPKPIDMVFMEDKYWDIINELREYVSKVERLKHERIVGFAKRFHFKLVVCVEEARERRYQEWLRLQSLPKPPRPIIIKSVQPKKKEVYVCYRTECHMKQFLSYDRYATHMLVHKQHDYIKDYQHHLAHQQKLHKIELENRLLNNIDFVKSQLPIEEHDLNINYPATTAVSTELIHQYNLYRILTTSMYSLTLVSKSADVLIPGSEILLDQQVMRLGTHPSCECPIGIKGEIGRLGMISKIHCLLYHTPPMSEKEDDEVDKLLKAKRQGKKKDLIDDDEESRRESKITIVDNSSLYGTYVVAKEGALKVPTKVTKGLVIQNGSLICVGVTIDGPPTLPVSEANSACLVFRLQLVNV